MKPKYNIFHVIILLIIIEGVGCKKFLDEKANKSLVVASTITDAQSLLDNFSSMNYTGIEFSGAFMDDDFYVTDKYYNTMQPYRQLLAIWDPSATESDPNWKAMFSYVSAANVSLETLEKIKPSNSEQSSYNLAKGGGLFFRALYHHQLAIVFSKAYDPTTSSNDLGIPYKTSSNINDPTVRLSVKDSYSAIISDLKTAASILPVSTIPISRPSKTAAFGMLARVYLTMGDYNNAFVFSDSALHLYNTLMNYNTFLPYSATSTTSPFPMFNSEDIFHSGCGGSSLFGSANWIVDSLLYQSYDTNDLRKTLFFAKTTMGPNTYCFRGSYERNNPSSPYSGISTNELFLIRAECNARLGNTAAAMSDLNYLMSARWKSGTQPNFTANTPAEALKVILRERRKELLQRNNMRFSDLKRLNLDPNFAITIRRTVKGVSYVLPPNDLRYQLLIPTTVVQASGIPQNPR